MNETSTAHQTREQVTPVLFFSLAQSSSKTHFLQKVDVRGMNNGGTNASFSTAMKTFGLVEPVNSSRRRIYLVACVAVFAWALLLFAEIISGHVLDLARLSFRLPRLIVWMFLFTGSLLTADIVIESWRMLLRSGPAWSNRKHFACVGIATLLLFVAQSAYYFWSANVLIQR